MRFCPTCYHPLAEIVNPDREDIVYRIDQADLNKHTQVASLMYEAGDVIKTMRGKCKQCERLKDAK